jgi:hypothetical protein
MLQHAARTGLDKRQRVCPVYSSSMCNQWISDEVEVVQADEEVCIAMAESQVDIMGGKMECLSSKDLMGYDYISIGKDGFVPISVKSVIGATRLAHDL